ncbi:uncharacterized protein LOC142348197 isoform X6 [Convolutriloba macropyga]|uniref:uncharacterized protein LOC142348197 isoform X6 n=1 Tax=Convolutriloba macropyga TaxID=536237 RepID=UPI003F528AD7
MSNSHNKDGNANLMSPNDVTGSDLIDEADVSSDQSDSLSETTSEPSVKINPAFKKVINNPKDLLPSSPFRKMGTNPTNDSSPKSVGSGEPSAKSPRNAVQTISRENMSNVEVFMKGALVQWATRAIQASYDQNSTGQVTSPVRKGSQDGQNEPVISFQELVDGIVLNDLMYDIHPSISCKAGVQADVEEQPHLRLQNLHQLMRNIRDYHTEVLGEALVGRLPDVSKIATEPSSVGGLAELKSILQLLLCCAMKSEVPVRERHIAIIQSLPLPDQTELMNYIQEAKNQAISLSAFDEMVHVEYQDVFKQLIDDRICLFDLWHEQAAQQLSTSVEPGGTESTPANTSGGTAQINGGSGGSGYWKRGSFHSRQGSNYGEIQQLNLQISDLKNRLMKKDNELNQKDEDLEAFSEENRTLSQENKRLKDQVNEAAREARSIRGLRDELDIFREKAARADRAESELEMAKHKLEELEYYRQRLEQSNKDYKMLEETKCSIEKHMQALENQVELLHETQRENIALQSQISSLETQLEERDSRMESLKKENQVLTVQNTASLNESASLHQQLANANYTQTLPDRHRTSSSVIRNFVHTTTSRPGAISVDEDDIDILIPEVLGDYITPRGSIVSLNSSCTSPTHGEGFTPRAAHRPSVGSECEDTLKFSMIQLEKEKQDYKTKAIEFETQLIQLTKEKAALEMEFEKAKSSVSREKGTMEELQQNLEKVLADKKSLHGTMEQLQQSHSSEILSLKEEIDSLTQNLESSRRQTSLNDSNMDSQLKEAQEQNIVLHARVQEFMSKCNQSESERRQIQRKVEVLQEELSQKSSSDSKLQQLSREIELLKHSLDEEKVKTSDLEKIESENLKLQIEVNKVKSKLDQNSNVEIQFDELRKDNLQLKAQNQKLTKQSENLNSLTQKINQLELENSEKQREIETLQHVIQVNKSELSRATELEARNQALNNDIQKLRKTLEMYSEKEREKGDELSNLQLEKEAVQRELETMRVNNETLEVKVKEYQVLDNDNAQLVKEKRQLERNIERLKRDIEEYETKDQDQRSKLAVMERELKRTQRFTERDLGKDEQIQELKNENAELRKQSMVDKKTNNCLREELVNEKLRHQDLQSEMEKVKNDLADKESNLKLQQHKNLLQQQSSNSRGSSPNTSFNNGSIMISNSLLDVKDKRIKELESLLAQKSAEKDTIQQELEVLRKQLPSRQNSGGSASSQGVGGLVLPGLDDLYWESKFNALDKEHVRARERIESLTQQLDARQTEMNELLSVKYRHEGQIEAYRKQLQKTHAETANIQVELSTLRSENASLKTQFVDEQSKCTRIDHQLNVRTKDLENAQSAYEQLLQGNEMLQALHSNLSHDYEDRMSQFTQLKNDHKKLTNTHRELQDKYDVLKSEKEVLEKQNSSLKGQRDALMTNDSGKQSSSSMGTSYAELEERLDNFKKSNSNLKMMNATLMEAFEKLKKERDAADSKRTESRQLQRENSELRSQVVNLHSFSEELELQNTQMKREYDEDPFRALLKTHSDQLSQMCIEYDALHEQLRSRQSRSRPTTRPSTMNNHHPSTAVANCEFEVPLTTSDTVAVASSGSVLLPEEGETNTEDFMSQVRTPSLEQLDDANIRMRQKFADIQSQQRKLYENSAFVTATLPRSNATDSPNPHRKRRSHIHLSRLSKSILNPTHWKGPNLIKQLKKSLSKSGSFSRDSQPKLAVVRRNSRDDDSVSVERNNDSSSFGSRESSMLRCLLCGSDTANDSPRLVQKRYSQLEDSLVHESNENQQLNAAPATFASTSTSGSYGLGSSNPGLPEEYATLSRKTRSKKQDRSTSSGGGQQQQPMSAKNKFLTRLGGGNNSSRNNSKECLVDSHMSDSFRNLKYSESPRKSLPDVASRADSPSVLQLPKFRPPDRLDDASTLSTSDLTGGQVVVKRRHFAVPPANKHAPNRLATKSEKKGHRVSWHDGSPQPSISHSTSYHSGLMNRKTFYEYGFPDMSLRFPETTITHSVAAVTDSRGGTRAVLDHDVITISPQHYMLSADSAGTETSFTYSLDLRVDPGSNVTAEVHHTPKDSKNSGVSKKHSADSNLPASNGAYNGTGYLTPENASSVAESSSSGKKTSKLKRTRNSFRGKFDTAFKTGSKSKPQLDPPEKLDLEPDYDRDRIPGIPSPVLEDQGGSGLFKGTLKQSRSHPNLRDMINRISTSINPGSNSNLSASFRIKNKKREKITQHDLHRTNSLERTKSPGLSISIPPHGPYDPYNDVSRVQTRRKNPGSAQSGHSAERPKSAVTPVGFGAMALNMGDLLDDAEIEDKISLEQFLKESNRSPKSRTPTPMSYQQSTPDFDRVQFGGRVVPPHLIIPPEGSTPPSPLLISSPSSSLSLASSVNTPIRGSLLALTEDSFDLNPSPPPIPPPRSHSTKVGLVPVDHLHLNIRRKYQEAVLNNDKDALREHLSCDELEDEYDEHKSPPIAPRQNLVRNHPSKSTPKSAEKSSRGLYSKHRLSQPSPDSTFRSDVEGGPGSSLSGSIGHSPQFHKLMASSNSGGSRGGGVGHSPQQRHPPPSSSSLPHSNIPLTRSYHGNLSGSSIGSDVLDRDGSSQGDPSPMKYQTPYNQSKPSWAKPGSRSGIIGSGTSVQQESSNRKSLEAVNSGPPVTHPRSSSKHASASASSLHRLSNPNPINSATQTRQNSGSNSQTTSHQQQQMGNSNIPSVSSIYHPSSSINSQTGISSGGSKGAATSANSAANRPLPPVPRSPREAQAPQMESENSLMTPEKEQNGKKNAAAVWYEYGCV